ncbi:MAG: D-alanyl-D-alanine carboxypeptidase/D-alanyl-D-alanine-endopeptidase [Gemmatimonadetes bacterium]|nr:D-alanyl-D-alanine carboxypeptidase/D-alanyl-D-alanine-endopeptidase [Gemmatimonadota bacterium]
MRRLAVLAALLPIAGPRTALGAQERPRGPLTAQIAPLLGGQPWRHATWGALVVSLTRGDTLFSYRADRHFVPASNAKLFTTAAALHLLGTDFRFVTVLFADGRVRNGEVFGNLVLYGTGDPTFGLDTARLAPFADSVVMAGIRRVRGDIVGDASFLGGELAGPGWSPDDLDSPFAAPPSALGAAENRIRITVMPGPAPGAPARYRLDPPNDYYAVSSVVLTGRPRTPAHIEVRRGRAGGVIELFGTIPAGGDRWSRWIVVAEPPVFAAGLLRQLLTARGVRITGGTRSVVDEASARARTMLARSAAGNDPFRGALAVRRSPPLEDLVTMINHRSHNLSAELTFRAIGRMVGGPGTFASGAAAVARYLTDRVGIPANAVQVTDGSGLSLLDEATPRSLVRLLAYVRRAPEGRAFYRSLPLVGQALAGRMAGTPATGRLRAKTGTLREVSALTGYVTAAGGEELAFSLIVNDAPSIALAREVQDSIGVLLSLFDRGGVGAH